MGLLDRLAGLTLGTAHPTATCCWCQSALVVGEMSGRRAWFCPIHAARQGAEALTVTPKDPDHARLLGVNVGTPVCLNVPLPSQVQFAEATAKNVLWGGHAGPGKSHGVRWWLYNRSLSVPGHEALLLRENFDQLEKTHLRAMAAELPMILGPRHARLVDRVAYFPEGSVIDCGHMADAASVSRYLSTNYGAIVPEEASVYPVDPEGLTPLAELSTRARVEYVDRQGRPVGPRFMPVSNPGGPSAGWLLDMFIDHRPDTDRYPMLKTKYDPSQWVYLPAKLRDNAYMGASYEDTLAVLSSWRYQQLAEGDWRVFSGQFFSKWHEARHVKDLDVPPGVAWYMSMDWGSNQPGCVGWYAILSDGRFYRRSEYKFQGEDVAEVAKAIKRREKDLGITQVQGRVADPAIWIKDGKTKATKSVGESIAETFRLQGIVLRPANNDRFNGWARCLQVLRTAPDGDPWFMVHPDCRYFIRTVSAARSDPGDPDDVNTVGDDHALDEWRYFVMSRPAPRALPVEDTPPVPGSIRWLRAQTTTNSGILAVR